GTALVVRGAPRFAVGERPLLFLARGEGGAWWPLNLALGVFRTADVDGRRVALGAADATGGLGAEASVRDLERFTAWLADRAAGVRRRADYLVAMPAESLRRAA